MSLMSTIQKSLKTTSNKDTVSLTCNQQTIKQRTPQTKAFNMTFGEERVPYNLYIPGERQDTKVAICNEEQTNNVL